MADGPLRVRVSNPLVGEESVLRPSMLTGLARAWGRNVERGYGDVALFEVGTVVSHPGDVEVPRSVRGGDAGVTKVELPTEHERILVLLGREGDDARTAVATWSALAERLGLLDVVVRSASAPKGWHPTRAGELVDRASGAVLGRVGELDPQYVQLLAPAAREGRRAGLVEIDFDVLATPGLVARRPETVSVPSRYPSASVDLAFVTPDAVNAADLAHAIRVADDLVESVTLFDVFRGAALEPTTRSLAYAVRLCASDRTLSDSEITAVRQRLIDAASSLGARLR
jgi:phenylalanyl-tRNA synthetase beta chain